MRGGLPSSVSSGMSTGVLPKQRIVDVQPAVVRDLADHGERAALAVAQRAERGELLGRDHEHVALLRFVAPELERRHARLVAQDLAQVDAAAGAPP